MAVYDESLLTHSVCDVTQPHIQPCPRQVSVLGILGSGLDRAHGDLNVNVAGHGLDESLRYVR